MCRVILKNFKVIMKLQDSEAQATSELKKNKVIVKNYLY